MFDKILIAVDIQEMGGADRLAQAALRLTASDGAEIHVINVVPDAGYSIVGAALGPDHGKKMLDDARKALEAWMHRTLPAEATGHVVHGTVYDAILKTARDIAADAIIVGAHRPELRDYLVGPNAARIVRHADQSVFVIR